MNIVEFARCLDTAQSTRQAEDLLKRYLSHFGFTCYAFTYYAGHTKTGRELRFHCVSSALQPWHAYYLQEKYADVDRSLETSYLQTVPLLWNVQEQLKQAKNNRERRIRKESIEFGIDIGLSIPMYGPDGDFVTMTLHQMRGGSCLREYEIWQYEWLAATHVFYHYLKKILIKNSQFAQPATRLTKREAQCLLLTAQSMRVTEIAKELNISPRTVNFHIQNANKKLGTHNKYQSVNQLYPFDRRILLK